MESQASALPYSRLQQKTLIVFAGAIALSAGVGAFAITLNSDHAELRAVGHPAFPPFVLLIGWSFVASGLVAWLRRPESSFGPLMWTVSLAWFAAALTASNDPVLFSIGVVITPLWIAIFIHALLSFPDGRLDSRFARAVVGLYYFDVIVLQFTWLAFADLGGSPTCTGCPDNVFLLADDPGLAAFFLIVEQPVVGMAALAGVLGILITRWRRASPPLRRVLAPVYFSGAVCVLILILTITVEPFSYDAGQIVGWVGGVAFTAVPLAFLMGLLRQQLARSAVGTLVTQLSESARPTDVREALSRALRDPSLEIAYWSPDIGGYVDADGRPKAVPQDGERQGVTFVAHGNEPIAVLLHDPSLREDEQLVGAVCSAAGLALKNARLQAELRGRLEELKASRTRILEIGEEERRRLERDLHDGAQQRLLAVLLELQGISRNSTHHDIDRVVSWSRTELECSLAELRELARGIHPAVLTDHGLAVALEEVVARSTVPTKLEVALEARPPKSVEAAAYFLACEALSNATKHAEATKAAVRVAATDGNLAIEITDNGRGGADPTRGSGLTGTSDRVAALDGTLEISSPPGGGTRVKAVFPCAL